MSASNDFRPRTLEQFVIFVPKGSCLEGMGRPRGLHPNFVGGRVCPRGVALQTANTADLQRGTAGAQVRARASNGRPPTFHGGPPL